MGKKKLLTKKRKVKLLVYGAIPTSAGVVTLAPFVTSVNPTLGAAMLGAGGASLVVSARKLKKMS